MLEKNIEKFLRSQAKKRDILVMKWTSPGNRGVPDDIAFWPGGRIDFLELKQDRGQLSPVQVHQLNRLTAKGANCYVLRGKADVNLYLMGLIDPWNSDPHR